MADPILNEKLVLEDLERISTLKSAPKIKTGVKMAIMDCYDRRPEREAFFELLSFAFRLHANLSRLELLDGIRTGVKEGLVIDEERLEGMSKTLTTACEDERAEMVKHFKPVTEMRLSTDKVH